jgi:tetraacyldisaccharide 4'-kinase
MVRSALSKKLLKFWYAKSTWAVVLAPLSWLFRLISFIRYQYFRQQNKNLSVPIIVVGYITLGGTGKTPFVSWLVKSLIERGYKPGIVMRGYGGNLTARQVISVQKTNEATLVGDEAKLLANTLSCPVVVGKKRFAAAEHLLARHGVNIIISDDGLQHYALPRDIEIAVIDGEKRFGNGMCLPVGPLRESPNRLKRVDFIVSNGKALDNEWLMQTALSNEMYHLHHPKLKANLSDFVGKKVHAIAGLGNPQRFFKMLEEKGIEFIAHAFPDHHRYSKEDFAFKDNYPILMTEKDAVKCKSLSLKDAWVAPLEVNLPLSFIDQIIRKMKHGPKITRHLGLSNL